MKKSAVFLSASGLVILYALQLSFAQTCVDENIILDTPPEGETANNASGWDRWRKTTRRYLQ